MSSDQKSASKWLGKSIKDARSAYVYASAMTFLSAGCFVVFSWFLSDFAALWLLEGEVLPLKLVYSAASLTGRYIFAHFASIINFNAGNIIATKVKKKIYPALLNNSQSDAISSTLLVTRAADDLKPFYAFFIPYAIASFVVSGLLLVVVFLMEKWVGYVLLTTFLVIPLQMIVIGVGAEALHQKHISLFIKYSAVFYNRLHTIAEIVNLDNFKPQYLFLSKKSKELNTATTNVMRVAILSSAVLELFVTIAIAGAAIYLGLSLLGIMPGPNYGIGYDFRKALFLLMLTPYYFFYLRKFVSAYHDRNRALAAAKLLMPFLHTDDQTLSHEVHLSHNSIIIRDLNFAYPDTVVKVLHNIQLTLPEKGLVLVKGISGSGKSTLLKILAGSIRVSEGVVSVNGRDNTWSQQWLKVNTSYMNQFPFIFDGTLGYNVFLERNPENQTEFPVFLNKILDKKNDGWETVLSHNGKQLSGGEKQLVTLARMMLHPRPVAVLDEPTASFDAATAKIIIDQIVTMAQERLVIVASHEEMFSGVATVTLNLNWGEQMQ